MLSHVLAAAGTLLIERMVCVYYVHICERLPLQQLRDLMHAFFLRDAECSCRRVDLKRRR